MNARENLISLLRRQGYEQVPIDLNPSPHIKGLLEAYIKERGHLYPEGYFDLPCRNISDYVRVPGDVSRFNAYHDPALLADPNMSVDFMGVGHLRTESSMHMTRMIHPLGKADSVEEIAAYPLAHYSGQENLRTVRAQVEAIHSQGLAARCYQGLAVWEHAWYLRGMENLMMDMMSTDPMAAALLDKVTAIAREQVEMAVAGGVDILLLGDDVGMQKTLMMSETMFCDWIKPRLGSLIAAARDIRKDVVVIFHSCGYVEPLIHHLMEIGVDVLNPVQPECMDFSRLHERFGDRLSFFGSLGTQSTLPFGTPEDVRRVVSRNLDIAGPQGGLFPAPTHMLEPEVPLENILAYIDVCRRYKG